jgi:Cellulase (glycosyl hydrolase family 5)
MTGYIARRALLGAALMQTLGGLSTAQVRSPRGLHGSSDSTTPPSGIFQVANGAVTDPSGKPWRANGINCCYRQVWGNGQPDLARFSSTALKRGFPGLNFVRFADLYSYGITRAAHPAYDATVRAWVQDLTSNGIVVEAEVHYTGAYASGQALIDAKRWLAEWASTFKDNPMVWFGTQNEPHGNAHGISRMMRVMYDAVRNTGNKSPVLFCCGNPGDEITGMDPAQFSSTSNTGFDTHYYGWIVSSGLSLGQVAAQCSAFRNQQGPMTVFCLETGDSTDGRNRDANWKQVLLQSLNNPPSSAAWYANWSDTGADQLLAAPYDFSSLTDYGQVVRTAMH